MQSGVKQGLGVFVYLLAGGELEPVSPIYMHFHEFHIHLFLVCV
jgi:hypothetical protein